MKRICFLEGDITRPGGTERVVSILVNNLALLNDYEIYVVSFRKSKTNPFYHLNENIKLIYFLDSNLLMQVKHLYYFLKQNDIKIVVNVDIGMAIYSLLLKLIYRFKLITWEHSNYFNDWNSKLIHYLRILSAKLSDQMIVLTNKDIENYKSNIKFTTPISCIRNPIVVDNQTKTFYNCNSKKIISVGNLIPIKRFDIAIEVAKNVFSKKGTEEWIWEIYGEGPEHVNLQNQIIKNGLQDRVFLRGLTTDIHSKYKEASFLVMTSKMEGLPMTLLEAQVSNLPIICFDIMTGPSEIIVNEVNGFLIDDGNINSMADKVLLLINDTVKRKNMSSNSKLKLNDYSLIQFIDSWKILIESLEVKK